MSEADVKRVMVKRVKEQGGYGRRYEDQYAVGIPDLIIIPRGGLVYFCEVKIIKTSDHFGVSLRQFEELRRVADAGGFTHAIPCMVGFEPKTRRLYIDMPQVRGMIKNMVFTENPWNLNDLFGIFGRNVQWANASGLGGSLHDISEVGSLPVTGV